MTAAPTPKGRGSATRMVVGGMMCLVAVVLSGYGFLKLAGVLSAGGYGTPAVRNALLVLGLAGALLAAGIATVIWDISKRYESR